MYKGASKGTGGSKRNGYARTASDWAIERASAQTPLAQRLTGIIVDDANFPKTLADYDLALLVIKLIGEGYTANKWLASVVPPLESKLDRYGSRAKLTAYERRVAETVIPELIQRWMGMWGFQD